MPSNANAKMKSAIKQCSICAKPCAYNYYHASRCCESQKNRKKNFFKLFFWAANNFFYALWKVGRIWVAIWWETVPYKTVIQSFFWFYEKIIVNLHDFNISMELSKNFAFGISIDDFLDFPIQQSKTRGYSRIQSYLFLTLPIFLKIF